MKSEPGSPMTLGNATAAQIPAGYPVKECSSN